VQDAVLRSAADHQRGTRGGTNVAPPPARRVVISTFMFTSTVRQNLLKGVSNQVGDVLACPVSRRPVEENQTDRPQLSSSGGSS